MTCIQVRNWSQDNKLIARSVLLTDWIYRYTLCMLHQRGWCIQTIFVYPLVSGSQRSTLFLSCLYVPQPLSKLFLCPSGSSFSISSYSPSLKALDRLSTKMKESEAESDVPAVFHCLFHPYFPHRKIAINPQIKFINKKYLN